MLCALALETVADVSNVDLVHEGVLRRVAAEVANEAALTAWLRAAAPPTKPGTATWSALREGGAHLVVHDPTVPRSPGGTGERLNLTWWVAVALEKPDGTPGAIWGLGGRAGWTSGTARRGNPHLRRRRAPRPRTARRARRAARSAGSGLPLAFSSDHLRLPAAARLGRPRSGWRVPTLRGQISLSFGGRASLATASLDGHRYAAAPTNSITRPT
jgi:hypothetical protein